MVAGVLVTVEFVVRTVMGTVMSLNFMGDWMRDRFNPRLRQL